MEKIRDLLDGECSSQLHQSLEFSVSFNTSVRYGIMISYGLLT